MDAISMDLSEFARLRDELARLPDALRDRVMKGAVGTGAGLIKREAQRLAPMWTGDVSQGHPPPGTLKAALYAARLVDKCTPQQEVWIVSVRKGKRTVSRGGAKGAKTNDRDAFYARWVEYGHYTRAPKAAGATAKARRAALQAGAVQGAHFVLPRPFLRPAFETQKTAAVAAMQTYLREHVPDAVAAFRYLNQKAA